MSSGEAIAGVIFDAYGTLFDVYAVEGTADSLFPGKGPAIARLWRDKQIAYSQIRTLSGRYAPFWQITEDALDYACEFARVRLGPDARDKLLRQYRGLPPHAEVRASLKALKERNLTLAVLSNGDATMLNEVIAAAGLSEFFDHILSVEPVRKFKTALEAYQLGPDAFGCPAANLLFVSSNGWDIAGASWFGYRTFWINRAGAPRERLDANPTDTGATMADLVRHLAP